MERTYPRLRPAPPTSDGQAGSSSDPPQSPTTLTRKRRVGVAVACTACRRRKTRCDGGQPICATCEKRGGDCYYEKSDSSSGTDGEPLVEAITLLNAMDPQEAIKILGILRNESNASAILSRLRFGAGNIPRQPSNLAAVSGTAGRSSLAMELEVRHPFTYPTVLPINIGDADSPLQWLLETNRGVSRPDPPGREGGQRNEIVPRPLPTRTSTYANALDGLNIIFWTSVPVRDEFAIKVLSLYLDTDHSLFGAFEPELFVQDLISQDGVHCSSLLVNAMMYWACQMYSAIDKDADALVEPFCREAERIWELEGRELLPINMVAAQFLSLAYLVRGKDHAVLKYISEAVRIGTAMGLFGVEESIAQSRIGHLSPEQLRAISYSAWGIFNWTTLMGVFYHQPGVEYPKCPPTLPIPSDDNDPAGAALEPLSTRLSVRPYYILFPILCSFWRILGEVATTYYSNKSGEIRDRVTLQFAEFKFRELLAWADNLPSSLARTGHKSHLVMTIHLWLHAAILDIFRPFIQMPGRPLLELKTLSSPMSTPDAVFAASVNQLKRLIIIYRFNYKSSAYSIIWHTALLYLANAMLQSTDAEDWLVYFLVCLYGYEGLRKSFRVAEVIVKGLLSMALRNGDMSGGHARRILAELQKNGLHDQVREEIRATFMVDLNLAMSQPGEATAEQLAGTFEDNALIMELTNVFEMEME